MGSGVTEEDREERQMLLLFWGEQRTAEEFSSEGVDTFCDREGSKLSFPAFGIVFLKQKGARISHSLLGMSPSIGNKLSWYSFCCSYKQYLEQILYLFRLSVR